MGRPQTIQIFLPSGDPRGLRVAEITTRIVRVIEVPRSLLDEFMKMPEAQQVGLYFLVGESEAGEDARLYIGQSGGIGGRLSQHNQKKDFWNKALVGVSLTNSLTQTHALFLEWMSIREAQKAARFVLENGNAGGCPHTPPPMRADCEEFFETVSTLVATLGFPVFEPLSKPVESKESQRFFCKGAGTSGQGLYTAEGFVVLKGSVGRLESVPSIKGTAGDKVRQRLLESKVMRPDGTSVVFQRDHLFRSPSMAALSLLGRTSNGWVDWRDENGRTLDEVVRQKPSAQAAPEAQ